MLLLLQDNSGVYVPVWVAVLGLLGVIVGLLSPFVTHYLNKRERQIELEKKEKEERLKDEKTRIEGFTFSNEAFGEAQNLIKEKNKQLVAYEEREKEFRTELNNKNDLLKESIGAQKFALEDRNFYMKKFEELKDALEVEKKECDEKIQKLTDNIEQMGKVLNDNNINFQFNN